MESHHNELRAMFVADQADRRTVAAREMTQPELSLRDYERRQRLENLVADGALRSADEYYYAAYLLQHGTLPEEFRRAHDFAAEAVTRGSRHARPLARRTRQAAAVRHAIRSHRHARLRDLRSGAGSF